MELERCYLLFCENLRLLLKVKNSYISIVLLKYNNKQKIKSWCNKCWKLCPLICKHSFTHLKYPHLLHFLSFLVECAQTFVGLIAGFRGKWSGITFYITSYVRTISKPTIIKRIYRVIICNVCYEPYNTSSCSNTLMLLVQVKYLNMK